MVPQKCVYGNFFSTVSNDELVCGFESAELGVLPIMEMWEKLPHLEPPGAKAFKVFTASEGGLLRFGPSNPQVAASCGCIQVFQNKFQSHGWEKCGPMEQGALKESL